MLAVAQTHQRPLQWHHLQTEEPAFSPALTAFLEPGRESYKVLQVCESALVGGTARIQCVLDLVCVHSWDLDRGDLWQWDFCMTSGASDDTAGRYRL